MEFSGFFFFFIGHFVSLYLYFSQQSEKSRSAKRWFGGTRLETSLRYLKFRGASKLDLNGLRNMQFRVFWMPIVLVTWPRKAVSYQLTSKREKSFLRILRFGAWSWFKIDSKNTWLLLITMCEIFDNRLSLDDFLQIDN